MAAQRRIVPVTRDAMPAYRPRILALDPDLIALLEIYIWLRDRYEVALWPGGHDLPALLRRSRPDVLVGDLHLGGRLDGWRLVRALSGAGGGMPAPGAANGCRWRGRARGSS
jgi:hypothetical protein